MHNGIRNIKARAVQDYSSADTLSDKFFVFDSYSENIENFNQMSVTDYPVRLDIVISIICEEGSLKVKIGYNEYTINKNDFIILFPDRVLQILEISDDFRAKVICLQEGFFDFNDDQSSLKVQNLLREYPCQSLPAAKMELFIFLFECMKTTVGDNANIYRKQIIHNYLDILFCEVCNLLAKVESKKRMLSPNERLFRKFIRDVEENYMKERNVGFYADRIYLTPKYFSTMVHRLTGKHAKEWIDEYTILEAKAMLKSSYLTIQQISYELNFATPSHFGRYFKHHTGVSPRQYRNE